jgi:hypothetical protein
MEHDASCGSSQKKILAVTRIDGAHHFVQTWSSMLVWPERHNGVVCSVLLDFLDAKGIGLHFCMHTTLSLREG